MLNTLVDAAGRALERAGRHVSERELYAQRAERLALHLGIADQRAHAPAVLAQRSHGCAPCCPVRAQTSTRSAFVPIVACFPLSGGCSG